MYSPHTHTHAPQIQLTFRNKTVCVLGGKFPLSLLRREQGELLSCCHPSARLFWWLKEKVRCGGWLEDSPQVPPTNNNNNKTHSQSVTQSRSDCWLMPPYGHALVPAASFNPRPSRGVGPGVPSAFWKHPPWFRLNKEATLAARSWLTLGLYLVLNGLT